MKNCNYYKQLVYSLCDDELDKDEIIELENHMATCDECREFYHCAKKMKMIIRTIPRIKPSENFNILLREKIRRESTAHMQPVKPFVRYAMPAFGIGMVVLAAGILSIRTLSHDDNPESMANRPSATGTQFKNFDNNSVNYVIEEYKTKSHEESLTDIDLQTDSLKRISDTHHIKSRITPVSF